MTSFCRLAILTLTLGAALAPLLPAPTTTPPKKPAKTKKTRLKAQMKSVVEKRSALEARLRAMKRTARYTKQNLQALDTRLDRVEEGIRDTRRRLTDLRREARTLDRKYAATRRELAATQRRVRARLRAFYVKGGAPPIAALMGTQDAGQIATRTFLITRIAGQDKALFDRYAALNRRAVAQLRRQRETVAQTATLMRESQVRQADLVGAKLEKRAMLSVLAGKQEDLRRAIAEYDRDEATIAAEIRRYEATIRARPGSALPDLSGGRLMRPAYGRITSPFGYRIHPVLRTRRLHTGTDFAAPAGAPIFAAASGRVIAAGWGGAYGNWIILDHGAGLSTMYGHCSRQLVRAGQTVTRGQTIGLVGSTGLSTGPHLHFEVWRHGAKVNPMAYLR